MPLNPDLVASYVYDSQPLYRALGAAETTDIDAIERLAKDLVPEVRAAVAVNPELPTDIAVELASDRSEAVRAAVAKNDALPLGHLHRLAFDPAMSVRTVVVRRLPPDDPAAREAKTQNDFERRYLATEAGEGLRRISPEARQEILTRAATRMRNSGENFAKAVESII